MPLFRIICEIFLLHLLLLFALSSGPFVFLRSALLSPLQVHVLVPPVSIDAVIREAQRNANANASAGVFGAAGAGGHGRCVNPFSGACGPVRAVAALKMAISNHCKNFHFRGEQKMNIEVEHQLRV
jgi:hypothetical protein